MVGEVQVSQTVSKRREETERADSKSRDPMPNDKLSFKRKERKPLEFSFEIH